jgi:hypothetical protein
VYLLDSNIQKFYHDIRIELEDFFGIPPLVPSVSSPVMPSPTEGAFREYLREIKQAKGDFNTFINKAQNDNKELLEVEIIRMEWARFFAATTIVLDKEVEYCNREIQRYEIEKERLLTELLAIDTDISTRGYKASELDKSELLRLRKETSEKQAAKILKRKDVLQYICPILMTGSSDTFTIANTLAQILAPLIIGGILAIPLMPVLFAAMAIIITRIGISTLCADSSQSSK